MTDPDRKRLTALLGMLGSEHAGERASAALLVERFRREHSLTWDEILAERGTPAPEAPKAQSAPPREPPSWVPPQRAPEPWGPPPRLGFFTWVAIRMEFSATEICWIRTFVLSVGTFILVCWAMLWVLRAAASVG